MRVTKMVWLLALMACAETDKVDATDDMEDSDSVVDSDRPDTDDDSVPTREVPLAFSPANTDDFDFDATSAPLGNSVSKAEPLRALGNPGVGKDGAYDGSDDTFDVDGEWTSFALRPGSDPRDDVRITGDLTVRAAGSVTIERDLRVTGKLVVIAGGAVHVSCAIVRAGAVHIEAHGAAGLRVDCATPLPSSVQVSSASGGPRMALWSAGPLTVGNNGAVVGPGLGTDDAKGFVFEALAGGDLSVLDTSTISPGQTDLDARPQAVTRVWAAGDLSIEGGSLSSRSGSANEDQPLDLRVGGSLAILDGQITGSSGSSVELRVEEGVHIDSTGPLGAGISGGTGANGRPAGAMTIWARGLQANRATIQGGISSVQPGNAGADLALHVQGDVVLGSGTPANAAYLYGGGSYCGAGGALDVQVDGAFRILKGEAAGGMNQTLGCEVPADAAGGNASVRATGAVELDPDNGYDVVGGTGTPEGSRTVVANDSSLVVQAPNTQLAGGDWLTSVPQPAHGVLDRVELIAEGDVQVELLLPDADDWVPVDDVVGQALPEGWRWRARLGWTIFTGSEVRWVTFVVNEPI